MSSCRTPNNDRLIQLMDDDTLLTYSKIHISMDSQELINELAARLEKRLLQENTPMED